MSNQFLLEIAYVIDSENGGMILALKHNGSRSQNRGRCVTFIQCSSVKIGCDPDPSQKPNPHYLYKFVVISGHYWQGLCC